MAAGVLASSTLVHEGRSGGKQEHISCASLLLSRRAGSGGRTTAQPNGGGCNLLGVQGGMGSPEGRGAAASTTQTAHGSQGRTGRYAGGGNGFACGPSTVGSAQLREMSRGGVLGGRAPDSLQTATVWMNLPGEMRETTAILWMKLQAAPWFSGLCTRDRPGHVGVAVWGPAPVCGEIRRKLALELGTEVHQPRTLIGVYGYGPSFGLNACDKNLYAQRELRRVWPTQDLNMVDCQHLSRSGLQRPTFSLTLEGVPPDREQAILRESDARLRHKVWVRCVTQQAAGQRKHVGPGTSLICIPRMEEANPSQEVAKQEPWRSPQSEEDNKEDEDRSNVSEV